MDFTPQRKINPKIIIIVIAILLGFPILLFVLLKYPITIMLLGALAIMFGYTWLKKKGVLA